jgi:hypothetical protein
MGRKTLPVIFLEKLMRSRVAEPCVILVRDLGVDLAVSSEKLAVQPGELAFVRQRQQIHGDGHRAVNAHSSPN